MEGASPPVCIVCGWIIPTYEFPRGPHGPYHQDCSGEVVWQPPVRDDPTRRTRLKSILLVHMGSSTLTPERFENLIDALSKEFST